MSKIISLFIAILLYTMGFFAFFEMIGIKREVELLLLIPVILYALTRLKKKCIYTSKINWLIILFILHEILYDGTMLRILDLSAALIVCSIIISSQKITTMRITQYVAIITSIFAVMSLTQFVIYKIDPSLGYYDIVRIDSQDTEKRTNYIDNPINLLGMVEFRDKDAVGRPHSFAYEASLLLLYFLLPAVLALTYEKFSKIFPFLSIAFCIIAGAGTTIIGVLIFSLYYIIYILNKRLVKYLIWMPLLLVFIVYTFLKIVSIDALLSLFNYVAQYSALFDKETSLTVRVGEYLFYFSELASHPFGLTENLRSSVGAFIASGLRGGWIALILFCYIFIDISKKILSISVAQRNRARVMILLFSILTTIMLVADYGFFHFFGFVLLTMIKMRIDELSNQPLEGNVE